MTHIYNTETLVLIETVDMNYIDALNYAIREYTDVPVDVVVNLDNLDRKREIARLDFETVFEAEQAEIIQRIRGGGHLLVSTGDGNIIIGPDGRDRANGTTVTLYWYPDRVIKYIEDAYASSGRTNRYQVANR